MSFLTKYNQLSAGLLLTMLLAGCPDEGGNGNDKAKVKGQVTDANGAQARILAGPGTVAAAVTAKLSTVSDNGTLTAAGQAEVQADGSYTIESDTVGETKMLIQILDSSDVVIGAVILDQALELKETTTAAPVTTETTVEAEVYVRIAASGEAQVDDIDTADLKARIDAQLATTVAASANVQGDLDALAQATASAQVALFSSLNTTAQATFDASLDSLVVLSAALDASAENATQSNLAYQAYLEGLVSVYQAQGFDGNEQADAQTTASMSFQLTVNARASAAVATQATIQAQAYQALALGLTADAILSAGGVADNAIQAFATASADLRADLRAANTTTASADAFASFEVSVISGNTSALSLALGTDFSGAVVLQQATIDAALTTFDAAVSVVSTASAQATAQAVLSAYAALDASVSAAVEASLLASGQATASACASIFVSTEASVLFSAQQ